MGSLLINIVVYNVLAVAALFLIMFKNPRYMMQDYPKEIRKDVPEKTKEENAERLFLAFRLCLS